MKKVLIVASVISFIEWFNKENIDYLRKEKGCEVHVACNLDYFSDTDEDRTEKYIKKLSCEGVILHNIHFARNPISKDNIAAYKELKSIMNSVHFDLIHCHTPTASMMTRLAGKAARKRGTVIMYTCHGFHFHNASSKLNWVVYYPIERFLSRYCDFIVTINHEDFSRARTFHCLNVRYIPGVGVDIDRIANISVDRRTVRESIGVPNDAFMIISAGELIERKNHEVIIRAIAQIRNERIYYVIAGKGPLKDHLIELSMTLGIHNRVILLGFRTDIFELYHASDISAFPSKIEGLGLSGVEAMAAGLPLVASNVHGILDYVVDGITGYAVKPDDVAGFANAIRNMIQNTDQTERMRKNCLKAVEPFEQSNALHAMWDIYNEILE